MVLWWWWWSRWPAHKHQISTSTTTSPNTPPAIASDVWNIQPIMKHEENEKEVRVSVAGDLNALSSTLHT